MVSFLPLTFTTHYLLTYCSCTTQFASTRWDYEPTLADWKAIWNMPKHHINTMLQPKRNDFTVAAGDYHFSCRNIMCMWEKVLCTQIKFACVKRFCRWSLYICNYNLCRNIFTIEVWEMDTQFSHLCVHHWSYNL